MMRHSKVAKAVFTDVGNVWNGGTLTPVAESRRPEFGAKNEDGAEKWCGIMVSAVLPLANAVGPDKNNSCR